MKIEKSNTKMERAGDKEREKKRKKIHEKENRRGKKRRKSANLTPPTPCQPQSTPTPPIMTTLRLHFPLREDDGGL